MATVDSGRWYDRYIQSLHWQEFRARVLRLHPSCQRCRMPRQMAKDELHRDLNVHHKNYRCLWHETLDDVEVLCRRCHEEETFWGDYWVRIGQLYAEMQERRPDA